MVSYVQYNWITKKNSVSKSGFKFNINYSEYNVVSSYVIMLHFCFVFKLRKLVLALLVVLK